MLVLVTVAGDETAADLVERLEREVVAAEINFQDDGRRRICIELMAEPDRNLGRLLNVVEEWLGEDGRSPTNVEIDGHSYTLGARV
jgi:hypothetical protein